MATQGKETLSAVPFLPRRVSLASLARAVQGCRGCPLYRDATQAVFGEGSSRAKVVLVGEQPGNDEDLQGHPFVGPAGRILAQALAGAGIDRAQTWVTNVVKHFKWEAKGKRRLHKKPGAREVAACMPWLDKELELLRPLVLVCLGATAAQALLGKDFKVTAERGKVLETNLARHALATIHPSAVLRQRTSEERQRELQRFTADLRVVARLLA